METGWNGGRLGWKKPLPRATFPSSSRGALGPRSRVTPSSNADRLVYWLGGHELPIVVTPGNPTRAGVVLSRADRFGQDGPVILLTSWSRRPIVEANGRGTMGPVGHREIR